MASMTATQTPVRRPSKPQTFSAWGAIQGRIALSSDVLAKAAEAAHEYHAAAEASEYSGDPVEDMCFPDWLDLRERWLPLDELRELGFEPSDKAQREHLLATVSVDQHVDAIHGPTFVLVLFNHGLRFKQGRQAHRTLAGEWFVFDDRRPHEVDGGPATITYLAWTVALVRASPTR